MSKLKAVIFDIDGVLIDSVDSNAEFFARIFKDVGVKYSKKEYIKLNHRPMYYLIQHFTKLRSKDKVDKIFEFAKKFPYPHNLVRVPKDGPSTIKKLSKKYKLAVVTARVGIGVRPVLKRYGYDKYIKVAVSFEDYKHPKPDPEPLLVALKKLKLKASEAIYIGDMESDIICSKAARMKSILYRQTYTQIKHSEPDYEISTFKELVKLLHAI